MLVYLAYVVLTSPESITILPDVVALGSFFFITSHAITSAQELHRYLKWWRWALLAVVLMALGTLYGFDFTQSAAITADKGGRLCLRHWMLDNPNALGHTLVTLLPMLYFEFFRDQRIVKKSIGIMLALLAGICVWHTQSKGAYLVGAGVLVVAVMLGRIWWIKVGVLALTLGAGQTVLYSLPRMSQMGDLRSDEGVAGRIMAWEIARGATRNSVTGEGWKHFAAVINWAGQRINKATHSSYIKVGADLGIPGLLLYLSLLCTSARTLLTFRGGTPRLEQLRRMLICLLASYAASGWMIDRAYHTEFFMLIGAIAAYHQLSIRSRVLQVEINAALKQTKTPGNTLLTRPLRRTVRRSSPLLRSLFQWRRYGLSDALVACCALQAVLSTWDYVIVSL